LFVVFFDHTFKVIQETRHMTTTIWWASLLLYFT